jgi:hypothetical protein
MGSLKLKCAGGDDAVSLQEPLLAIVMRSVTSKAWAVRAMCVGYSIFRELTSRTILKMRGSSKSSDESESCDDRR